MKNREMTLSLATEGEETSMCEGAVTRGNANSLGGFSCVLPPNFGTTTGWRSRRDQERSTNCNNETLDYTDVFVNDNFNNINVSFNKCNDNNNRATTIDVTKTSTYGARSYSDDIVAKLYKLTVMPIAGSSLRAAALDRYGRTEKSPES